MGIYIYVRFKELILKHLNDMFPRKKMLLFQMGMFDSWRMKNFASGYVLEYRMAIGLGKYLTHLWDCFLCVTCDIDNIITNIYVNAWPAKNVDLSITNSGEKPSRWVDTRGYEIGFF